MKRREFIVGLGGAAAWPLTAWAQPRERMRRIGVLVSSDENDPEAKVWLSGFTRGLTELGWTDVRNLRVDVHWAISPDQIRMLAKELVDLQPDVILSEGTPATAALQRETRTIPIVFVLVADPVGAGFAASLPRPGGNITGFIHMEAAMSGKWLELLTEITPGVKRVSIMFNPNVAPGGGSYYLLAFEAAARKLNVEAITSPVHNDNEIEAVMNALGHEPRGGLVVPTDAFLFVHRKTIISLAARNTVPVIYPSTVRVREGGLFSYGPDQADIFRRAAAYVDRILRGTKPVDLPVQLPVKFEMAVMPRPPRRLALPCHNRSCCALTR